MYDEHPDWVDAGADKERQDLGSERDDPGEHEDVWASGYVPRDLRDYSIS